MYFRERCFAPQPDARRGSALTLEVDVRFGSLRSVVRATVAVAMLGIAVPSAAQVQTATPASMGKDEITALAKVHD